MTTKKRSPKHEPSMKDKYSVDESEDSEHFHLFAELGKLLIMLGLTKSEIGRIANLALSTLKDERRDTPAKNADFRSNENLRIAAAAVFRWHRDRRFLTKNASPRPLPVAGTRSIESLILLCEKGAEAKPIVAQMIKAKLLDEVAPGRFVPNSACLIPLVTHPMATARSVHQIRTLVWSLMGNISPGKSGPLVEREASVRNLPVRDIPAFRDFSRQQGASLIQMLDEWLELRQAVHARSKSTGRTVEVGAHVFAYVAPARILRKQKSSK